MLERRRGRPGDRRLEEHSVLINDSPLLVVRRTRTSSFASFFRVYAGRVVPDHACSPGSQGRCSARASRIRDRSRGSRMGRSVTSTAVIVAIAELLHATGARDWFLPPGEISTSPAHLGAAEPR